MAIQRDLAFPSVSLLCLQCCLRRKRGKAGKTTASEGCTQIPLTTYSLKSISTYHHPESPLPDCPHLLLFPTDISILKTLPARPTSFMTASEASFPICNPMKLTATLGDMWQVAESLKLLLSLKSVLSAVDRVFKLRLSVSTLNQVLRQDL